MDNKETKKQIYELLGKMYEAYIIAYQFEPIGIETILTKDILNEYKQKRPDLFEKQLINPQNAKTSNAIMIPPKEIDGLFSIVINENYFFNSTQVQDWQWIGTFTHELTHVYDYSSYVKMNKIDNYDIVQIETIHRSFALWTEFHARATGDSWIRKVKFPDEADEDDQIDDILKIEFPYKRNELLQKLESSNVGFSDYLYAMMQFMGSYSVWENLFPYVFDEKMRRRVFEDSSKMLDLYEFLIRHQTVEEANKDFDKMLDIIQMDFGGYDI